MPRATAARNDRSTKAINGLAKASGKNGRILPKTQRAASAASRLQVGVSLPVQFRTAVNRKPATTATV
jgi:hypothetical protein